MEQTASFTILKLTLHQPFVPQGWADEVLLHCYGARVVRQGKYRAMLELAVACGEFDLSLLCGKLSHRFSGELTTGTVRDGKFVGVSPAQTYCFKMTPSCYRHIQTNLRMYRLIHWSLLEDSAATDAANKGLPDGWAPMPVVAGIAL